MIDRLAAGAQALDQPAAAIGVELAHDVVEQHQRRRAALGLQHAALGQQQRQQAQPLLALGAVEPQVAAFAQQRDVVAVRPVGREAALEIRVARARRARRPAQSASGALLRGR